MTLVSMKISKLRLLTMVVRLWEPIVMTYLKYIFSHCLTQYLKSKLDSYTLFRAGAQSRITWTIVIKMEFLGEKIVAKWKERSCEISDMYVGFATVKTFIYYFNAGMRHSFIHSYFCDCNLRRSDNHLLWFCRLN